MLFRSPVHSDRGNQIAFALRDRLRSAPVAPGILRHLIIRTTQNDREAVATLVVTRNDKSLRKPIRSLLESDDRPDGFFININEKLGPFMLGLRRSKSTAAATFGRLLEASPI